VRRTWEDSIMLSNDAVHELRQRWLPHMTDDGLRRIAGLLERGDPLLIRRTWVVAGAMGCLASHAAWHHPATAHLGETAGSEWLSHVTGIAPGRSFVIRDWDESSPCDWSVRSEILAIFREELARRCGQAAAPRDVAGRRHCVTV
jgi:hypothetical protein